MKFPKFPYLRSEPYRRYVASHSCFACDWYESQCAHSNQKKHGKAGSIKASDEFSFPLCPPRPGHMGCHTMHDLCIEMSKEERDEIEDRYIERMWGIAAKDGWHMGRKLKAAA